MELCETLKKLQSTMPPIFAGTALDNYTGNGYRWRTLQNEKCRGETPQGMFLRQGGRKLLVDRDRFLAYWQSKLRR
jgi:hypothetical protein